MSVEDTLEGIGAFLKGRFEVIRLLGEGGQARTFLGVDHHSGAAVAVKELRLGRVDDWKALELFEREGAALRALNHERIPAYIDAFHVEEEGERRFFLVQEYVDGRNLKKWMEEGRRFQEEEILEMADQILEILEYLHGRKPAVIHRDIKPSNLILNDKGELFLIDFGAVQVVENHTLVGSTVVGTSGYMPPEQLTGRTIPASDLYALGALILHLISHVHPARFEVRRMKIVYEDSIHVWGFLKAFLDELLEPLVEDRPGEAAELRRRLASRKRGGKGGEIVPGEGEFPALPENSELTISLRRKSLLVREPALATAKRRLLLAGLIAVVPPTAAVLLMLISPAISLGGMLLLWGAIALALLPSVRDAWRRAPFYLEHYLDDEGFEFQRWMRTSVKGKNEDLRSIRLVSAGEIRMLGMLPRRAHLEVQAGIRTKRLFQHLSQAELEVFFRAIENFYEGEKKGLPGKKGKKRRRR